MFKEIVKGARVEDRSADRGVYVDYSSRTPNTGAYNSLFVVLDLPGTSFVVKQRQRSHWPLFIFYLPSNYLKFFTFILQMDKNP